MSCSRPLLILLAVLATGRTVYAADAKIDVERFDEMMQAVSNWNRWGATDTLGTINLVTPEVRKAAVGSVRQGVSVSLARIAEQRAAADNGAPYEHTMLGVGTEPEPGSDLIFGAGMDRIAVSFHGFVHTHLDAWPHMFYEGKIYNGHAQKTVTAAGAEVLSVINLRDGILTRGVLVDMPVMLDVPWLPHDYAITAADLDRFEAWSGVRIRAGDAVLLRTGRWTERAANGPWAPMQDGMAGVHPDVAAWLHARDVAVIGSDAAMDALPSRVEGFGFPFHQLAIVSMGMPILDALDLEDASVTAQQLRQRTFLLTVAPLPVEGATGSPVNPIATF